jgi:hypothetical protein
MRLRDGECERQAQTRASAAAGGVSGRAEEPLEQSRSVLRGNANTLVSHSPPDLLA